MSEHNNHDEVIKGSGDAFADLGITLNDADRFKIEIASAITTIVRRGDLTQVEVGKIIGIDQAKVSALMRGRLNGFSVERLIRYLVKLGASVDVHISAPYIAATSRSPTHPGRVVVRMDTAVAC